MCEENLDDEWMDFMNDTVKKKDITEHAFPPSDFKPEYSDIYISTQTKIGYLDKAVDLESIYWKLPIIDYKNPIEGIIKKTIKINSKSPEEVVILEENLKNQQGSRFDVLSYINTQSGNVLRFKDNRKVTVGVSKKDLVNFRKKKKSAFYNCFAVIIRIKYKDKFHEINIKLFNTGKLEIPGIQNVETLNIAVNILLTIIKDVSGLEFTYLKDKMDTVLINSNFTCNFFVLRNTLHNILKYKYSLHSLLDPCSYPGIQPKFFYNKDNKKHDGICYCEKKCSVDKKNRTNNNCKIISIMIFRTGSILIIGKCDEYIINIVYKFITNLLTTEIHNGIITERIETEKKKPKKYRKRIILFSS